MMLATDSTMSTRPRAATMPGFVPETTAKATRFTLIELLVVVAIIAILMAILLPSLKRAKDVAKDLSCKNNMKQQALSFNLYATDNAGWYPMSLGYEAGSFGDYRNSYMACNYGINWMRQNQTDGRPAQTFLSPAYGDSFGMWSCPANQYSGNHANWDNWKKWIEAGEWYGKGNLFTSYLACRPLSSHSNTYNGSDTISKTGGGSQSVHRYIGGTSLFRSIAEQPLSADSAFDARLQTSDYNSTAKMFTRFRHINHYNYARVDGAVGQTMVKGMWFGTQNLADLVRLENNPNSGYSPIFQGDFRKFYWSNCQWFPGW